MTDRPRLRELSARLGIEDGYESALDGAWVPTPDTTREALVAAMRGAGKAVVFTTVILCAGFGTLTFSEFTAVRELGMLGGVTLVAALVGDLLLLPLVLLGVRRGAPGLGEPQPEAGLAG